MTIFLGLNAAGLALFFGFGWLFVQIFRTLRPDFDLNTDQFLSPALLASLIIASVLVIVLHELVHGLFFLILTGDRPKFGFTGAYAYAAAPDWYLPRNPYLAVGLAPFVLLTLLGMAGVLILPTRTLPIVLLALTINAAGSVGDLAVVAWLLTKADTILVNDEGDRFTLYEP